MAGDGAGTPGCAVYEPQLIKEFLKENPKLKIKLCVIGGQKSGKTYLINEYLKYHDFIIQKYIEHSENSPSDPVFDGNSESFSDNLPIKSRKS